MSSKRTPMVLLVVGLLLASGFSALTSARPTAAAVDVEAVQRASWGLATDGGARAVDRFSALGWAVEEVGGTIFAGGVFLDVTNGNRTERQPRLAAFSLDGVWLESFRPDVGGPVLAMEPGPGGSLFVGGEMDEWNGRQIGALAKIDPATGELWPGWNTRLYGGTSVVRDLSLGPDGWLYAAGTFTTASDRNNPRTVYSVVRLDPATGAIDWSWIPRTQGGAVWGVSASYTRPVVYLAGWNNVMAGNQVVGVSSTDAADVTWTGFAMNYPCCDHMYDIQATPHGTVLAVGEQHGAYLYDENDAMSLIISHVTSYDSRYQNSSVRRGGDYQDIEMIGDTLYASCHCWGSHSTGAGFIATYSSDLARSNGVHTGSVSATVAYNARTGVRETNFNPYMAGDIGGFGVLGASDGCLWIAGGINAVGQPGAQSAGRDLVRLCPPGGGNPPPVDPVPSCLTTFNDNTVTVTWDEVAGATDYVIHRTVDGAGPYWRGVASVPPFVDTTRAGEIVYTVSARNNRGDRSDPTECGLDGDGDGDGNGDDRDDDNDGLPDSVEGEGVDTDGDGVPDRLDGDSDNDSIADVIEAGLADADDDFAVDDPALAATVTDPPDTDGDGTPDFRDLDADGDGTFDVAEGPYARFDTNGDGTIDAGDDGGGNDGNGNGVDDLLEQPDVAAPASCSAIIDGDTVNVSWEAAAGASEYIVYRTANGAGPFWRGRTAGLSFTDTNRDATLVYSVAARTAAGLRSAATECSGDVVPPAAIPPVASCSVAVDAADPNAVTISWTEPDDLEAQLPGGRSDSSAYLIYRRVDDSPDFWRGRVEDGSTFSDRLRAGTIAYSVVVRDGEQRTDPVTCDPVVEGR